MSQTLHNYAKSKKQSIMGKGIAIGATFSISNPGIPVMTISPQGGISTGGPKAAVLINTTAGNSIKIDDCFIQYLDMISSLLGIPIKYTDFSNLSNEARIGYVNQVIRNIKLNQLDI